MDIQKTVGSNVRKYRVAAAISQEELAARIEVAQGYISKLESGQVNITITTLSQLAAALKIEPKALVE